MKTAILGLAVGLAAGFACAEEPAKAEKAPLKVLMIGNSFSVQMVKSMPPVAKSLGCKLDICSMYIGGCSLERHWQNVCAPTSTPYNVTRSVDGESREAFKGNIPSVLKSEKWDIVTIQQASHFSWVPESYHPFGDNLVKYIRENAPQAKIVVQETWSYTPWDKRLKGWGIDQNEMYAKLKDAYARLAKQYNLPVIRMGTAVQEWRRRLPVKYTEKSFGGDVTGGGSQKPEDQFKRTVENKWEPNCDVFHLNARGTYLQALVWSAKILNADFSKLKYRRDCVTEDEMKLMIEIATEVK